MKRIFIFILMLLFGVSVVSAIGLEDSFTTPSIGISSTGASMILSQSFTTGNNYNLTNVSINIEKIGNPTGNMFIQIYSDSGDLPGILLGTSDLVPTSSFSSLSYVQFNGINLVSNVSAATKYVIVINKDGSHDNSNKITWYGSSSTSYGGGRAGMNSGSWSLFAIQFDFNFKTYSSLGVTPPTSSILTFNNITANNITLINDTFYNDTIQFQTFVTNTSTNGLVNQTYSLNGASVVQYATNNLNGSVNLNLSEGYYNISFQAFNNETSVNSTNYSLIVDRSAPVINIIGNVTQDSFFVNFSTIFAVNYSISGEDFCTLNITYLSANESDSNFFINCTDTQVFSRAGLYNGFLTAKDNAGNIATGSVNGTINPEIDVTYFNEATTAQLFNFTVNIFHPDGRVTQQNDTNGSVFLSPVNDGVLDLGLHTLEFIKPSYIITNNTFTVNTTNAGTNVSYNITPVTLTIKMFNSNNTVEQLTFNVTIINSTDSATFNNQFNFSKLFSEIPSGDITIVVSSDGFAETKFFNTINQFTAISINGLLIPESIFAIIKFTTLEFGSSDPIEGLLIEAQQFINGSFVTISQASTDGTGQTFMNLDVLENYKYIFSKDGFITATINAIPGTLEYTIRLKLSVEEFEFADGIGYGFTPSSTLLFIPDNFTFTGLVSGSSITSSSYTLTDQDDNILFTDTSTNPTGTTFSTTLEITNTSGISLITATISYVKDATTTTVSKSYQVTTLENASFIGAATTYGLNTDEESQLTRWFMMIFALAAGLLAGRLLNLNATGSGLLMIPIAGFFMFLGWMPLAYFSVLMAASLFFFIGGSLITR